MDSAFFVDSSSEVLEGGGDWALAGGGGWVRGKGRNDIVVVTIMCLGEVGEGVELRRG